VVVAVIAVRVVQPAIAQVIDVVAVRHLLVAAPLVLALASDRGTFGRVGRADGDDVLVIMAVVRGVQVAVVQEADVAIVLNARMATVLAVYVIVLVVDVVAHLSFLRGTDTHFIIGGRRAPS
jgi:hypothetical protein